MFTARHARGNTARSYSSGVCSQHDTRAGTQRGRTGAVYVHSTTRAGEHSEVVQERCMFTARHARGNTARSYSSGVCSQHDMFSLQVRLSVLPTLAGSQ